VSVTTSKNRRKNVDGNECVEIYPKNNR